MYNSEWYIIVLHLMALGYSEILCRQVYFDCGWNEELAANFLRQYAFKDRDL